MAARYVRIGQYPDYRDEVRGTLAEILASTANPGTYAAPEDVTGTFLEMGADGLWTGASAGALTQAQADALYASGAMATVKVGTPGNVSGVPYSWSGSAWGAVGGGSPKRYRPRTARRIFQDGSSIQAVAATQTVINQFNTSQQCASLEFVLENYGSTAITYDKIAIKSVNSHKNDGGSGGNTVLTYLGATSVTVPAAVSGAGTVNCKPSRVKLDKIQISATARVDGGSGYLFNIRGYSAAGGGGLTIAPTYSGLQTAGGLDYAGGTYAGDQATNFNGIAINGNSSPVLGFPIFTSREDVSTVLFIGDSIVNGASVGWTIQAEKALRTAGKRVNFVNFAQGGVDSNYFAYALGEALSLLKPTHLVLPFGSINDTAGDAVSLPLSLAVDNIQSVADFGCNVFSFSTLAAPLYTARNPYVVYRNTVLQAHGVKYADMYPLTVDVSNPNGDNSKYADGVHPNGATYTLMANTFVAAFSGEV